MNERLTNIIYSLKQGDLSRGVGVVLAVITVLIVNVFNMLSNTMEKVVENFKGVMCMKLVESVLYAAPLLALENKYNFTMEEN